MNPSKFSLADLLTLFGAAGFGFFCYLSLNFLSLGATLQSIVWAGVFALPLGGLAFGAKWLKSTSRNFKTCIIWEWILLLLFAIYACYAVFWFSHYFAVLDQKEEIQNKVTVNIEQAERMFPDFEKYANNRENIYKSRLNSIVAAKSVSPGDYRNYGFIDGISDAQQVENKMFILHAQLFPSNYEGENGIKQVAINWLAKSKHTLESKWAFTFGLVDVVKNVQISITDWKNKLIQFSTFRAQGEIANNYNYPLNFDDVTDKITERGIPTPSSIAYSLGLIILMLLSYFVSKRSTKNHYSLFSIITRKKTANKSDIDIKY